MRCVSETMDYREPKVPTYVTQNYHLIAYEMHRWYDSYTYRHATAPKLLNLQQGQKLINNRHSINNLKRTSTSSIVRTVTSTRT
jgi:hypothetical protein